MHLLLSSIGLLLMALVAGSLSSTVQVSAAMEDHYTGELAALRFTQPLTATDTVMSDGDMYQQSQALEQHTESGDPFLQSANFLTLPFPQDPDMKILQGWCYNFGDNPCGHNGIDYIKSSVLYPKENWTHFPVLAAADGEAYWNSSNYGNFVWIRHTINGVAYSTYYGHLQSVESFIPRAGTGTARVRRGQQIGIAGDTGTIGCSQPCKHLHFEVHQGHVYNSNKRIDPYDVYDQYHNYPDPGGINGLYAGSNHLWTANPPDYAAASHPNVTFDPSDYNRDGKPDLYAIHRHDPNGDRTSVHILNGADGFQSYLQQVRTSKHVTDEPGRWSFLLGDYNRDGKPDLYAIDRHDPNGDRTSVHILNGADGFQSHLQQVRTRMHVTDEPGRWSFLLGDYNRDGKPDLYAIDRHDPNGNRTSVHILNGADGFQSYLQQVRTRMHVTDEPGRWSFLLGDYNRDGKPDLYAIDRHDPNGDRTSVHVLNGADGFQSYLQQVRTRKHVTDEPGMWSFMLGDYNRDGTPDLYAIHRHDPNGDRTSVHVLNGADGFQSYLQQVRTRMHVTDAYCLWDFATGEACRQEETDEALSIAIDHPRAEVVAGSKVTIDGWALHSAASNGTGVNKVHLYLGGPAGQGGTMIGNASYGIERPDVARVHGERYRYSGYTFDWDSGDTAPGTHELYVYAYSTVTGEWSSKMRKMVIVADDSAIFAADFSTGAPGSFFTFTATNFPPDADAVIAIKGPGDADFRQQQRVTMDADGNLVVVLYIPDDAQSGTYTVRLTATPASLAFTNAVAQETTIEVAADASQHPRPDGDDPVIPVAPSGELHVYLPVIIR
jgi:murein DD-endopeptidase MepM/ murein hydrolase activator NlpD